jgi:hypothetical protein
LTRFDVEIVGCRLVVEEVERERVKERCIYTPLEDTEL